MDGVRFLHSLTIQNFLSYGATGETLELEPLNVVIGPNGSGKSNLIETIGLLQALPGTLDSFIRQGGGAREWFWKGHTNSLPVSDTCIEAVIAYPTGEMPLRYRISLALESERLVVVDEAIENESRQSSSDKSDVYLFYQFRKGNPIINRRQPDSVGDQRSHRSLHRESLLFNQSVLAQRKDPELYPELTYLGNQFPKIRFYREWNLGRYTHFLHQKERIAQNPALPPLIPPCKGGKLPPLCKGRVGEGYSGVLVQDLSIPRQECLKRSIYLKIFYWKMRVIWVSY